MRKIKILILFIIIFLNLNSNVFAQNIFDSTHTAKYAAYLFQTQQFNLAITEYERLVFISPANKTAKLQLIKSYRKNKQYEFGINKINFFQKSNNFEMNNGFANEFMKLLLLSGNIYQANFFVNNSNALRKIEKNEYYLSILLLQNNYEQAQLYIQANNSETDFYNSLENIVAQTEQIKYKSPLLAMSFSAIVPGLGKIYTKDWKDGLISFVFVGLNAFMAYRGFSQKGVESIYGWVFAGLSFGFYAGNIFGSYKSAKRYNNRINHKIHENVQILFDNNF